VRRSYKHFDSPVWEDFAARACDPVFIESHAWSPLIHYVKSEKRYKPNIGKTKPKKRDIMFASHRDACILAKYAADIGEQLDAHYKASGLHQNVIAYRRLGRANYHFSADAYRFAKERSECVILCFDITGFFDNLDHAILKDRLKRLLGASELSKDWFAIFRHVTKFRRVERKALEANEEFKARLKADTKEPVATIAEIKAASIPIIDNPNKFGIPQGTPISAAFSNLYMMDVDRVMVDACNAIGGLYQRYSDDILVVCAPEYESEITAALKASVSAHKLQIKDEKTERAAFTPGSLDAFQYLGFNVSQDGAVIRPSSLSRQWRKAKRAIKTTKARGKDALAKGKTTHISTKRLRQRFWPTGARNFSKYARRAAGEFGSKDIIRQTLRLERMVDQAIRTIEK
jgi:RNA-directed DNA polymerase